MKLSPVIRRSIARGIEHGDFLRGTSARLDDAFGYREWLHFCLSADGIDLVVNFSLADDTRPAAPSGTEAARLVCIVRSTGWDGDVEQFAPRDVRVSRGRVDMRFGESYVRYERGAFRVRVRCRARALSVDLSLRPTTLPSVVNDIVLSDDLPCHWFLVPRLLATGTVEASGRVHELVDVPAYHDHNWGYFRWGHDFAWMWGYAHEQGPSDPWTFVFDRLTNRAKTIDCGRGIVLWKGARQQRLFGARDISFREHGYLRPRSTIKLPRALALLSSGDAMSLPAEIQGLARNQNDSLEFVFRGEHACHILVPNDDDLGLTAISEVSGELSFCGVVAGEPMEGRIRAMFEFLGA